MEHSAPVLKLKEIKPDLIFRHRVSRLRVFDPAAIGETGENSIGILVAYRDVPSLFDVSELQNDLNIRLGSKVYLAVEGMIQPDWLDAIHEGAFDV